MAKELKPFDKILVRNSNKGYWIPAFYGFKSKDMKHHLTSAGWQDECIPYEGNEEYLGTNKDYVCRNFPEIVESEDKRISKALIKLVKKAGEGYENVIDGVSIENAISWLEKKGEQKPYASETMNEKGDFDSGFTRMMEREQKSAGWSKKDEQISNAIVKYLGGSDALGVDLQSAICWVENVKDRVQPQPKHEWSEEDEENKKTLRFLAYENCDAEDASRLITWIENLKEQILHLRAVYEVTRLKEDDK